MDDLNFYILIIGQILNALMVIIGFVSLYKTIQYTKWSKTIDITNNYLKRFSELIEDSKKILNEEEKILFWKQFWYIQQEQYYLSKKNLIDKVFFDIWMEYRIKEWHENKFGNLEGYQEGYYKVKKELTEEFVNFIESVFSRINR